MKATKNQATRKARKELRKAVEHLTSIMDYPEAEADLKSIDNMNMEEAILSLTVIEKTIQIAQSI